MAELNTTRQQHESQVSETPEQIRLELPHLSMAALAWGPRDGRLAVCLHGFPDSAWSWQEVGIRLAQHGFRVIAPFTRGYAPTAVPHDGEYHLGALMYDTIELHRYLRGGDDAVVIGHDWGGFTVNALSAYPGSPFGRHIALSMPAVAALAAKRHRIGTLIPLSLRQIRLSWYILFFQLPLLPERVVDRLIPWLWREWSSSDFDTDDGARRARQALPDNANRRAAISYYRALLRERSPARYRELHSHRFEMPLTPLLHFQGARDGGVDVRYADFLQDLYPAGSVVRVLRGGHFLQLEQPDDVTDAVLEFIRRPVAPHSPST